MLNYMKFYLKKRKGKVPKYSMKKSNNEKNQALLMKGRKRKNKKIKYSHHVNKIKHKI